MFVRLFTRLTRLGSEVRGFQPCGSVTLFLGQKTTHHSQTRSHPQAIGSFFFEAFVLDSWAHSVSVHICIFVHPKVDRISKKSFIFPFYEDVRKNKNIFYLLQDDCIHLSCHGDLLSGSSVGW